MELEVPHLLKLANCTLHDTGNQEPSGILFKDLLVAVGGLGGQLGRLRRRGFGG